MGFSDSCHYAGYLDQILCLFLQRFYLRVYSAMVYFINCSFLALIMFVSLCVFMVYGDFAYMGMVWLDRQYCIGSDGINKGR